jgi:hypothetical protein
MSTQSPGDRWIKFLRAYGPLPEGNSQEAEHIGSLSDKLGIPKLSFNHPQYQALEAMFRSDDVDKVVVITGTAGDGKTTMCFDLIEMLSGNSPSASDTSKGIGTFTTLPDFGGKSMSVIYDVTGWRTKKDDGTLSDHDVAEFEKVAQCATGTGGHPFILAVNDGQLHEVAKSLPDNCTPPLKTFFDELLKIHGGSQKTSKICPNLELVNLSATSSAELMSICMDGILSRPEWDCLQKEPDNPMFGEFSSVAANYKLIQSDTVKQRLMNLATLADACGYHLPVRSINLLLVNALLGHPDFRGKLVKPGVEAERNFQQDTRHKAALHKNIFGLNLSKAELKKRVLYQFLNDLRIGEETTNDIDEIIIYGDKHPKFSSMHKALVENIPDNQKEPELERTRIKYIKGEIHDEKETTEFRKLLGEERKRLFIHAKNEQFKEYNLWLTSNFHYAGVYIEHFLAPLKNNQKVEEEHITLLVAGLNRVWCGLLVSVESSYNIYVATGLDVTTAPVSDILLSEISISDVSLTKHPVSPNPEFIIQHRGQSFSFPVTMLRFEFLMRVARGAMPTSFSSEIYSNLQALKQKAIRSLQLKPDAQRVIMLGLEESGSIKKTHITL